MTDIAYQIEKLEEKAAKDVVNEAYKRVSARYAAEMNEERRVECSGTSSADVELVESSDEEWPPEQIGPNGWPRDAQGYPLPRISVCGAGHIDARGCLAPGDHELCPPLLASWIAVPPARRGPIAGGA